MTILQKTWLEEGKAEVGQQLAQMSVSGWAVWWSQGPSSQKSEGQTEGPEIGSVWVRAV